MLTKDFTKLCLMYKKELTADFKIKLLCRKPSETVRIKRLMIYSPARLLVVFFIFAVCTVSVSAQIYVSPDAVKTTVIDAEDLKILAKSPENEKPVLINFWATWCGPCRVEFPDLVEIDKDYREKGLNFVIVSIDNLSLVDTRVSDFLKVYKAEMPSYLIDLDSMETVKAIRRIAPRFSGTYPLTLLFNAKGKLVYQKTGVVDPKILRAQIEKVLPEQQHK